MRIVAIGDALMCEALAYLGIHPVDANGDIIGTLKGLLKDRNNVILVGATLAEQYAKDITALQKEYKDSMIITVPDSASEAKLDSQSLIAEMLGIKV